jgi:hypothetical protein
MAIYDGTAPSEEHTSGPGPAETLWTCREPDCTFVGTSDEVLDHVADPATGPGHRAFDRVGS